MQNNWIATVLIDSNREKDPTKNPERLEDFEKIVEKICERESGDGLILFPAGYYHTGEAEPRTYYKSIMTKISPILNSHSSHTFICVGIDGRWHREKRNGMKDAIWDRDQIAIAIDRDGIQAIARKFHLSPQERGITQDTRRIKVQKAEFYDDRYREDGKSRIFRLNNSRYYLAVCYDGYAHQIPNVYSKNPGTDVILNLIHRFPKRGEGSSLGYQVICGFKGITEMWNCPVFGSSIFIQRPDPIRSWPTAAFCPYEDTNRKSGCPYEHPNRKRGNYDEIVISADDVFSISEQGMRLNDQDAIVKIYRKYHEKILYLKMEYASQQIDEPHKNLINNQKIGLKEIRPPNQQRNAWNEKYFISNIRDCCGEETVNIMEKLIKWAKDRNLSLDARNKSFFPFLKLANGKGYQSFRVTPQGWIEFQFKYMIKYAPFQKPIIQNEWLRLINKIPGMNFSIDSFQNERLPRKSISVLKNPEDFDYFIVANDYFFNIVRSSIKSSLV